MNPKDSLLACRRKIDDALDSLDEYDDHTLLTIVAAVLLTLARIAVNARLDEHEIEGQEAPDPAPDEA